MNKHHIEDVFDEMISDIRSIKMNTYFMHRK